MRSPSPEPDDVFDVIAVHSDNTDGRQAVGESWIDPTQGLRRRRAIGRFDYLISSPRNWPAPLERPGAALACARAAAVFGCC